MSASVSDTYASAHDPLCPFGGFPSEPNDCMFPSGLSSVCDVIARVRADAEAHEKAAVEAAFQRGLASRTVKKARVVPSASASMKTPLADKFIEKRQAREQAIRDCISIVESLYVNDDDPDWDWPLQAAEQALRALLEGSE